jgi:hypothetical protein
MVGLLPLRVLITALYCAGLGESATVSLSQRWATLIQTDIVIVTCRYNRDGDKFRYLAGVGPRHTFRRRLRDGLSAAGGIASQISTRSAIFHFIEALGDRERPRAITPCGSMKRSPWPASMSCKTMLARSWDLPVPELPMT